MARITEFVFQEDLNNKKCKEENSGKHCTWVIETRYGFLKVQGDSYLSWSSALMVFINTVLEWLYSLPI